MNILFDPLFLAASLSHFGVDVLNGQVAVLLAFLSGPLGLSNTSLGAVSTIYSVTGALSQPIFGYISDRIGPRWVGVGGLLWMAVFFSFAVITPGRASLVLLVLASLGSGAFHPAGTMQATLVGRARHDGRETTSTSYFFLLGQIGLFLGPLLGGLILASGGPRGLLILTIPAAPVAVYAAVQLGKPRAAESETSNPSDSIKKSKSGKGLKYGFWLIVALAFLAAFRIWVQQNMSVFVPKYLNDLGYSPDIYGVIASLFMGGSAVGNVAGGMLADKFGKRKIAMATLAISSVPLFILPSVKDITWFYAIMPFAGMFAGASHSIVVVFAQRLIPGGMGLASGLILGFMFSSGAIGVFFSGFLADLWGIPFVFMLSGVITLIAAALAMILREE